MISKVDNKYNGGMKEINKKSFLIMGGGINDEKIKKAKEMKKDILTNLNNLATSFKKIQGNKESTSNVERKLASTGFINNDGTNAFDNLLMTYDENINNKKMPHEMAQGLFYNKVKNLNLDPEEELQINITDKIVFCVLIYIIRLATLFICYYIIDNNKLTDITSVLKTYLLWYIIIYIGIVVLINIDAFKMRIIFNYLNMHINMGGIGFHITLMLIFVYLIYLLTKNILGDEPPSIELGENEKIKLKYKLDLLTIIIFIFTCILIFIV